MVISYKLYIVIVMHYTLKFLSMASVLHKASCIYRWSLLEQKCRTVFVPFLAKSGVGATIAIVASAFLGQRKVIWLHGKAGITRALMGIKHDPY